VYLPAVEEAAETSYNEIETAPARGNETILLVEDEVGIRRTIARMLSSLGYRVMTAAQGAEALELARRMERPPGLLVTDVVMPGMGGQDLAQRLVALHPALRVLYISGYMENTIAHHGTLENGIDLLSKPFSAATLAAKVREILDR
jgi:DNA-binding response OmpR family regulator